MVQPLKKCSNCLNFLSVTLFSISNIEKDGLQRKCKTCNALYYKKNKSKIHSQNKNWANTNWNKVLEHKKKWRDNNKQRCNYYCAQRRAAKLQRTPKWADLKRIKQIYDNKPKGYVVDHVIPLQGKNVSGLHVENNLQYLKASDNAKKSNKW